MLISESYKEQNKVLHKEESYGISSLKWINQIEQVATANNIQNILDYGCGKGIVKRVFGDRVSEYDPAIEGKDSTPEPREMVVCTDVLEHIEPELLVHVLRDLRRCVLRLGFFVVDIRPAKKILSDGRNAHLIQESYLWWLNKFDEAGFQLNTFQNFNGKFLVLVQ